MSEETPNTETPPAVETEAATETKQTVPYERFAQKVAELKAIEAQLAEAAQAVDTAKAWEDRFNTLAAEREAEKRQFTQTSALLRAGIHDEDISELARWRFEKSESEDFAEWLKNEAKNDPVLKPHLQNAPQTAPQAPPPAAKPQPNVNAGAKTTPPPRGEFSPEAVQNMTVEELRANYGKIAGAWGYTPRTFKS